ncbi:tyrosine-protein phosphatase [Streptomyces sp. SBR177]
MSLSRRALLSAAGATALLAVTAPPGLARPGVRTLSDVRRVPLQGAVNVRDLGGYGTYDGARVRHGLVYRGDHLARLTDADVTVLGGLGLARVVDFRIPLEVRYDGTDRLPAGVSALSRPVTDNGLYGQLLTAIGSRDPVRQEEMLGGGRAAAFMTEVYRTFVTGADNRAGFGATLRELAAPARARGSSTAPRARTAPGGRVGCCWCSWASPSPSPPTTTWRPTPTAPPTTPASGRA